MVLTCEDALSAVRGDNQDGCVLLLDEFHPEDVAALKVDTFDHQDSNLQI